LSSRVSDRDDCRQLTAIIISTIINVISEHLQDSADAAQRCVVAGDISVGDAIE